LEVNLVNGFSPLDAKPLTSWRLFNLLPVMENGRSVSGLTLEVDDTAVDRGERPRGTCNRGVSMGYKIRIRPTLSTALGPLALPGWLLYPTLPLLVTMRLLEELAVLDLVLKPPPLPWMGGRDTRPKPRWGDGGGRRCCCRPCWTGEPERLRGRCRLRGSG